MSAMSFKRDTAVLFNWKQSATELAAIATISPILQ